MSITSFAPDVRSLLAKRGAYSGTLNCCSMPKKICNACKEEKTIDLFFKKMGVCKECYNLSRRIANAHGFGARRWANMTDEQKRIKREGLKVTREKHKDIHGYKNIARRVVHEALRKGEIVRLPCEVCGAHKVQAHHYLGYELEHALDIKWLCQTHHFEVHRSYKLNTRSLGNK